MLYQHDLTLGTKTRNYVFNGMLVAQRINNVGNGDVKFFLTDHLGSTTTTIRANGTLEAQLRYDPWGEERYTVGATPTGYRYTGQRQDDTLGLYDYKARYYDPTIGRFISADTIIPEQINPQSFNRYTYVYNNPTKYTDSSGHCIDGISTAACWLLAVMVATTFGVSGIQNGDLSLWNPLSYPTITEIHGKRVDAPTSSNLTGWLVEQLVNTANSQTIVDMADLWQGNIIEQMGVLAAWIAMVRTGGVWDFKPDIIAAGIRFGDDLITLGSHDLNFQVVANIFFGFIGRMIGFSASFLQFGAGIAQSEHGWGLWLKNFIGYPGGFGDQEFDAWAIGFGIYLYDLFKDDLSKLTEEAFSQALDDYIADNPIPPFP